MAERAEVVARIGARLKKDLGDRLREFPVETRLGDEGVVVVLKGAAGSVTALRGLREKLQPLMKKILRECGAGGAKFATVDSQEDGDMLVKIELTFL